MRPCNFLLKGKAVRSWKRLVLVMAGLQAGWAAACAICVGGQTGETLLMRLQAAQALALAQAAPDQGPARVLQTLRGAQVERVQVAGWMPGVDAALQQGDDATPWLLAAVAASQAWWAVGHLPLQRAAWLQALLDPAQPGRAERLVPDLESDWPLVAEIAYDELAALPYATMRTLQPQLDPVRLRGWLQNPALRARHPLYYLLLGLAGTAADAQELEQSVLRADAQRSMAELSAMLAAIVSLRGTPGLDWVAQHFVHADGPELQTQAALLALNVLGSDGQRIPQEAVVSTYAAFITAQPARAGWVASDLGTWGHWEFAEAFATALRSAPEQVFSSRYAIVLYLLRNPRPEAARVLQALRTERLL